MVAGVRDVTPAQSATVTSAGAAASVASEDPGSLQVEKEDLIASFLRYEEAKAPRNVPVRPFAPPTGHCWIPAVKGWQMG